LNLFFYDSYIYKKDELWSSTQLVFTKSALPLGICLDSGILS
jgi:hypothetical protein